MNELKPIAELDRSTALGLRALATDLDDTVTYERKIPLGNLEWIERLGGSGIKVFAVTGRAAGFGVTLTQYFDLFDAVITENGTMVCTNGRVDPLIDRVRLAEAVKRLDQAFEHVRERLPHLKPDPGGFSRLTERVFMRSGMSDEDQRLIDEIARSLELEVVTSSIMTHIHTGMSNKAKGLIKVLDEHLGSFDPAEVITVGDSPNDSPLFNPEVFPLSVGVANVADFADVMQYRPAFIADLPQGKGFAQICERILRLREA